MVIVDHLITVGRADRDQTVRDHHLITVRPDYGDQTVIASKK